MRDPLLSRSFPITLMCQTKGSKHVSVLALKSTPATIPLPVRGPGGPLTSASWNASSLSALEQACDLGPGAT